MNELTDFEKEIADCLDFEPSAAVNRRVAADIGRQAWKNRVMRVLRMPSRIPIAAALAVAVGAGSLLYFRSERANSEEAVEYVETLFEIQGLTADEYIDSGYLYM